MTDTQPGRHQGPRRLQHALPCATRFKVVQLQVSRALPRVGLRDLSQAVCPACESLRLSIPFDPRPNG